MLSHPLTVRRCTDGPRGADFKNGGYGLTSLKNGHQTHIE